MKHCAPGSTIVAASGPRLGDLRYSRAYTLSIEALHTLCCGRGSIRARLEAIDFEFNALRDTALPDSGEIRQNFAKLRSLATRDAPSREGEGRLPATLAAAHHTVHYKIAQLVWDIHREFSEYMQGAA